jgi:hypothetical protein
MSVAVEDFIPSLTGFAHSLPIITTLRLCNRYGKGPACFVTNLPTEIVELIESHLHVAMRERAFEEWEQQEKCTEGRCDCGFDRREALFARSEGIVVPMRDTAQSLDPMLPTCTSNSTGCTTLRHVCPHYANVRDFAIRTRDFRVLDADAKLVKRCFGLDVWTPLRHSYDVHPDDVRLRTGLDYRNGREEVLQSGVRRAARLYLMLPGSMQSRCCGGNECSERVCLKQEFAAVLSPDREMMRRFLRVFRMLGLQTGERLCLLEMVVNLADSDTKDENNGEMRRRFLEKLARSGYAIAGHVIDGEAWPDIHHVWRTSSWESRMQAGWLAVEA